MRGPRISVKELRKIGWSFWDPIGLADEDGRYPAGAEDEYDSYLLRVAGLLTNSQGEDVAIDYLVRIARDHMGLGHANLSAATKTVREIRCYLEKLANEIGKAKS